MNLGFKGIMTRKYKHTPEYIMKKSIDRLAENASQTYDRLILGRMTEASSLFGLGEPKGYRKKRVTKHLHISVPTIEKSYDDDCESEGWLLSIKRINTHIPIGKEIIEVPIYKKPKGHVIKFSRYSDLSKKTIGEIKVSKQYGKRIIERDGIKCKYCGEYFKNKHGLHIHWYYCSVKSFSEMEKQIVNNKQYKRLLVDSALIPVPYYLPSFFKFIEAKEFGMIYNIRYLLKGKK